MSTCAGANRGVLEGDDRRIACNDDFSRLVSGAVDIYAGTWDLDFVVALKQDIVAGADSQAGQSLVRKHCGEQTTLGT